VIGAEEEFASTTDSDSVDLTISCSRGGCRGVDEGRVHGCPDRARVKLWSQSRIETKQLADERTVIVAVTTDAEGAGGRVTSP
jgi:hypothetical protein